MRKNTRDFVVAVAGGDLGSGGIDTIYGPYTRQAAERAAEQIEADVDHDQAEPVYVTVKRIRKWEP